MHPPEPLTRLPPSLWRFAWRGDNASGRYKPGHGVHWHGLLRGQPIRRKPNAPERSAR